MALPQDSSKYLSLYDSSPPRSRQATSNAGLAASIWAPQPQPSESTWPRALDSFSRVSDRDMIDFNGLSGHQKPPGLHLISREDVFASLNSVTPSNKDIGAIGDGRKKNSPEFEDKVSICYHYRVSDAYAHHRHRFFFLSMSSSSFVLLISTRLLLLLESLSSTLMLTKTLLIFLPHLCRRRYSPRLTSRLLGLSLILKIWASLRMTRLMVCF
jgi:hypothetical protein